MSIGPSRDSTSATIAATAASSLTSHGDAMPSTSAATASHLSRLRSTTATCAPAAANARQQAAPMPLAPPVITATLPVSSMAGLYVGRCLEPLQGNLGTAIGREHGVDHVLDDAVSDEERQALDQRHV